jgi:hypothetical protein
VRNSTDTDFPSGFRNSGSTQVIVEVPQPNGGAKIDVRTHVSNGTLYIQKSTESTPGTSLMTGVQTIQVNYYKTAGTTQTAVDGSPLTATEVKVRLTGVSDQAVTTVEALVALRNTLGGL